jgi:hypothetical protein
VPFSLDPQPGENEIECANCGALIYDQLSRCPNCGVNLYEPELDSEFDYRYEEHSSKSGWMHKVKDLFHRVMHKPFSAEEVFGDALDQAVYYDDLLQRVGGDHTIVERLIEFEKGLYPNSTRIQWLKNAIVRWEKDNRSSPKTD